MFGRYDSVSADESALDIAKYGVDPLERTVLQGLVPGCPQWLVSDSLTRYRRKTGEPICNNKAFAREKRCRRVTNGRAGEAGHRIQLHSVRFAVICGFDSRHKGHLPGGSAASLSFAFAADVRIIHFHPTRKPFYRFTFMHDLHQLVRDFPGGILADAQATGQFKAGNAALRVLTKE
jgi:hypothetical protein